MDKSPPPKVLELEVGYQKKRKTMHYPMVSAAAVKFYQHDPHLVVQYRRVCCCAVFVGDTAAPEVVLPFHNGRESTSIFVASRFGPLRVNPLFTFNYTANYDGVNGWYIIKLV